jgi:hypothetical protein
MKHVLDVLISFRATIHCTTPQLIQVRVTKINGLVTALSGNHGVFKRVENV